ncbi:unnamed protein product [Durusdinium trenchii]|uniref:Palmitoyltransferase n=2 Tax=Durusdinium trenchii TaxID=1381693 RepID=A0ABP0PF56_9DINO
MQSVRAGPSPVGSYLPAVALQPPPAGYMGDHGPPYQHMMQLMAPAMNDASPVNQTLTTVTAVSTQAKEEELESDDEQSVAEDKKMEYVYCGIDWKPFLPTALASSTVAGAICVFFIQIPIICRATGMREVALYTTFGVLFLITLGCMMYCINADPGQSRKTRNVSHDIEEGLPQRAHKSFQYRRPIRRYDHYCKWVKNVIGLLNHREFILMVGGLIAIALLGILMDLWVAILLAEEGSLDAEVAVALHLGYSVALLAVAGPIMKIHFGLISRNELAQEWRSNQHYIANNTSKGDNVYVEELSDDEFNEIFDRGEFIYDKNRNPFDHGFARNCLNFWCKPRWPADSKGNF